jgi:hypothetical protein
MIKRCIKKTLQEDWTALKNKLFEKLAILIEDRIDTVINTEGWYTKY